MSLADDLRSRLGDRYVIERELGRGGMGAVYLARDRRLDRLVALKVLPSEYALLPALRERFLRETRMAASFSHPNIVPVYAVEETPDLLAYVMAYIEGESLAERVHRAGTLSIRETVRLLQDVAYALAYAHGRGVVHRDIKPDNIMIERATGRALVMDFGIARVITAPSGPSSTAAEGLTRIGEVIGTPEYMSPEQATGDAVDGRSDLYSLGLTAHFALTGRPPMSGTTTGKVLAKQITEALPPLVSLRTDAPASLGAAIDCCVAKDPADRFPTAEQLVEALDAAQLAGPEIPLPIRLFAQELGTLSMIAVGALLVSTILYGQSENGLDSLDALLPMIVLFGVLMTRVLQSLSEARRLARAGFTADDIQRGLAAVVAERAQRREQLRADPASHRVRRRTLAGGMLGIVVAVGLARAAFAFRHEIRPRYYQTDRPGVVLIMVAAVLFGVGVVLLLRSPFRMPIGERLFRIGWLGPLGRAFVRGAGWRISRGQQQNLTPVLMRTPSSGAQRTPAVKSADVASLDLLRRLDSRVTELERWRSRVGAAPAADD